MNDRYIVAIDLGTFKIAVTVAKATGNHVQIIYYKETPSAGIRYNSVYNVMQVKEPLTRAIKEAEDALGIRITQAVVAMPKYTIRQETSTGKIEDRGFDTDITAEDIADLKSFAEDLYPLKDGEKEAIYGAVAQSFSDGENFQIIENDIIGMTSDILEGNFKIFIGKKSDLNKIDTVLKKSGITAIRKYFTADSTAKAVLSEAEMENGVALIDFGAGCTSVSVYHGNIMRHYASIPFGGKNITDDIKSECQISERLAENIKLAFGACMPEKLQSLSEKTIHIRSNSAEPDKQLPVKYLSEIITARVEEILMAIFYEIQQSGFADMLRSGIVVTGGCAQIANLGNLIYDLSGYRARTGYPKNLFSCQGCDGISDTSAATSVGLVLVAKEQTEINCAISGDSYVEKTVFTALADTDTGSEAQDSGTSETAATLFTEEEMGPAVTEDDKKKKRKEKKLTWTTRFTKFWGDLYEQVNQTGEEIENEEV